jgi:type VI secretion system protein VasG
MAISLKAIVSRLNDATRTTLESAAGLCLARTHYDVEIEHFLLKLLDASDSDFARILKQFGVDKSRLAAELTRSLDKLKTGNARTPAFSPSLFRMLTEAWTIGSLEFGANQIRTGFVTLALVSDDELARILREVSREMQKIEPEALRKQLGAIMADSLEYVEEAPPVGGSIRRAGRPQTRRENAQPRSIHHQRDRQRAGRQDRSRTRPRFRNPPDHRHPSAPPAE